MVDTTRHGNGPLHQDGLTAAKAGHRDLQRSSQTSHHVDTRHTLCLHASRRRGPRTVPMSKPRDQAKPARNAGVLTDQIDAAHAPYRHPDNSSSSSSSSPRAMSPAAGKPDRVATLGQPPPRPGRDVHPESPVPPRDRVTVGVSAHASLATLRQDHGVYADAVGSVIAKRYRRSLAFGWSVIAFQSPNYLDLINLDGTVAASRSFRAWRK